jgi:hypothetical protein
MDRPRETKRFDDAFLLNVTADDETDPLAGFESETGLADPADRSAIRHADAQTPVPALPRRGQIALDQVLVRVGHVSWAEAVAVVEALCAALSKSGGERAPAMSQVAITASGEVVASADGPKPKGAAGALLARMLHTLTPARVMPAPLRLLVGKWISSGEGYPLREFAKELSYFARPDGRALIQAVYTRALATPVPAASRIRPPSAVRGLPMTARRFAVPNARQLLGAAAAVLALATGLTAMRWWWTSSPLPSNPALFSDLQTSPGAGLTAASMTVDGPAPTGPAGRPASNAASPVTTRPAASAGAAAPTRAPRRSSTSAPPSSRPVVPAAAPPPALTGIAGAARADRNVTADSAVVPASPIYSAADVDVTPPTFTQPQIPTPLVDEASPEMNTIELIVSASGAVERVRLVSRPRRMPDMMLLSGAKNWEFEPAVKDGQSVRYRLELSWAATP